MVRIWDVSTGEQLLRFVAHEESVRSVAWSPDGDRLAGASGGASGSVKIWDAPGWVHRLDRERNPFPGKSRRNQNRTTNQ